jgi:predicted phage terminase large subunit-like protein
VLSRAQSLIESLHRTYGEKAPEVLRHTLAHFDVRGMAALSYCWDFWARPEQIPPPLPWHNWLLMTGAGFGKTRAAAEYVVRSALDGTAQAVVLVGATEEDLVATMLEGRSGILACCPPWVRPKYLSSKKTVEFPNGVMLRGLSAESPERLRGWEHELAWCDELGAWPNEQANYTWSLLKGRQRIGRNPRTVVTTTPKRGAKLLYLLRDQAENAGDIRTIVTRGHSSDNAINVSADEVGYLLYGTELGRQEIEGELLEELEGALFREEWFRRGEAPPAHEIRRIVVAIDPSLNAGEYAGEAGVIAACLGTDGGFYVLEDASGKMTPDGWARRAVELHEKWKAHEIVVETNVGGEAVKGTIRRVSGNVLIQGVAASRGKATRAEPVAALYQQGRVVHRAGLGALEREMVRWDPDSRVSPGRLDALVWALTRLSALAPTVSGIRSGVAKFALGGEGGRHRGGVWR